MVEQKTEDHIDLTVVVDRSGSMSEMREEAEGGLNAFFQKQAEVAPNTRVTLVQFDTEYEFVHRDRKVTELPKYELLPRGCTALLDAAGKAAAEALERFKKNGATKKIFVVLTDGLENSSREWTKEKVKKSLEQLKSRACEIVFLGANIDSFAEAGAVGIPASHTADYDPRHVRAAVDIIAQSVSDYSQGARSSLAYTPQERVSMMGGQDKRVSRTRIDRYRKGHGLSWSALERAAGVGNTTLKRFVAGETQELSEGTLERLKGAFPDLMS